MNIGERLCQLRHKARLSQEELGRRIGRIQPEIFRWEKGIVRIPANELPALAKELGVPIDAFFHDDETPEPAHAH